MCRFPVLSYWSHDAVAQRARWSLDAALARLRQSQHHISQGIEAKRRRVRDFDRNIMEMGVRYRRQGVVQPLTPEDRAALRNELKRRQMYRRRIDRFYGLLSTVEQQIALLEDSGILQQSAHAMRQGAAVRMLRPEDIDDVLERVAEQQELANDAARMMQDAADAAAGVRDMTDADLDAELARLLADDEFTGQFAAEDVARAQRAARLADLPPADPLIDETAVVAARAVLML